jgi:peptide/nickel transport system substrate-binding protein
MVPIRTLLLAVAAAIALSTLPAEARTFKFAFQGDLNSLDPHTLNESFTLGALGNTFEGLTKRDRDLKIVPMTSSSPWTGCAGRP